MWLLAAAAISGRLLVVAVAVVALVLLLAELYVITLPVIVALLLSTLLVPPARWLQRRGWKPALAAVAVVGGFLVTFGALFAILVPQFTAGLAEVGEDVQGGLQQITDWITGVLPLTGDELDNLVDRGIDQVRDNIGGITSGVVAGAIVAFEVIAGLLLSLVLTFFFVKDGERIVDWLLARAPTRRREDLRAVSARCWKTLTGYLRGTAIIALVDAIGIGVGLLVIGVPLVLPLAVLTFLGGFFPLVGATLAGLVAVLVALVSGGVVDALLVLAVVIGVQQLESNVLEPVVLARAVPLHPVIVLLAIASGAVLAGIAGAFLAVPVAAVISAAGNELRLRHERDEADSDPADGADEAQSERNAGAATAS